MGCQRQFQRVVRIASGVRQQNLRFTQRHPDLSLRPLPLLDDPVVRRASGLRVSKPPRLRSGKAGGERQSARARIHRAAVDDVHRTKVPSRRKTAERGRNCRSFGGVEPADQPDPPAAIAKQIAGGSRDAGSGVLSGPAAGENFLRGHP